MCSSMHSRQRVLRTSGFDSVNLDALPLETIAAAAVFFVGLVGSSSSSICSGVTATISKVISEWERTPRGERGCCGDVNSQGVVITDVADVGGLVFGLYRLSC
jgi:hypothetical protein